MKDITILLPLHEINEEIGLMLGNALSSIESFHNDVNLLIISPPDVKEKLKDFDFGDKLSVQVLENTSEDTDFVTQINLGIDNCETEWFSIFEVDDEYTSVWLTSMNEHIKTYKDVDVFLPIVIDLNMKKEIVSYTNETSWAYGFTENQGFIDNEVLLDFQNYQTSGGLYRTEVIKDIGKFKDNIKLTFTYEFLLRLTHNNVKVMVVPRFGYKHMNFRPESLFWSYKNNEEQKLTEDEILYWVKTAKEEFFFKNKRDLIVMKE